MGFSRTYLILVLFLTFSGPALAQEITPNEKASRYHRVLQKKPGNATLFGRFVQSWLDTDSKENLQKWLEETTKEGTPADWQILASLHDYLGQDKSALRALNEAVKAAPDDPALRLTRAKLNARLLDFEAALGDLNKASTDPKLGTEASKLKGIYLARAGRIDEALTTWKALVEKLPKDEELREDLIEVQVVEGLFKEAAATATDLVAMTRDPYKKALRQLRLGDLQILGGDRDGGLKTYEIIVATTGADTWLEREVLAQIERIFLREDNIKGLRAFYQKLNEAHPRRVSIRKALARQMAANKEIDEAISLFREVLKITPGDLGNREEFIAFLEGAEKLELAREELNELIKQRSDDPSLREHLVRLESSLKNPEGVKAGLLKVKELRANSPEGLIAVASLYQQAELPKEADELLREGRKSYPDSDEITEALASFLMTNDGEAEALALWKKMADGANREGLLRVSRSLASHGKQSEAFKLLSSRLGDFEKDPLFLTQVCQLALTREENIEAIPTGKKLIELATTPTDLENSVRLTRKLIARAAKVAETLTTEPVSIGDRCLHASLIAQQGDLPRASRILEKAEAEDPSNLARFFRIRFEEEFGNTASAIALLRKIVATPDGRKTVHYRRLVSLLESNGDFEAALTAVEQWKEIAPGDQSAWIRRSEILLSLKRATDAATELRRLIGKFGADEDNRSRLAEALLADGEERPARLIYERLYEEAEDLPAKLKWIGKLAEAAYQQNQLPELLADFERRKRANPTSVAPLLALAEIHRTRGNYEQRRSALLEASRRKPDDLSLLLNIAAEEERYGEFARAASILGEAVKNDPGTSIKRRLANLHLRMGEIQTGLRLLGEIPGENDDPRNIENTVTALIGGREIFAAANYLGNHLKKYETDWRLQYLHAILLELEQEPERSFEVFSSLQNTRTEIKGITPILGKKGRNPVPSYLKPTRGTPPGWQELSHLRSIIESESYNLTRILRGYSRSTRTTRLIELPGSPREARILGSLQAARLAQEFSGEERKAAFEKINIPGIAAFPLFFANQYDTKKYQEQLENSLKKDPGSLFVLKEWLTRDFTVGDEDPAKVKKRLEAFVRLSKESPQEAALLVLRSVREGDLHQESIPGLFEILFKNTPPDELGDILVMFDDLEDTLDYYSEETHMKSAKIFLEYGLTLKKVPHILSWTSSPIRYIVKQKDPDLTVSLLNLIARRSPDPNQSSGYLPSFGTGYRSGSSDILLPPEFPQEYFDNIPYILGSFIHRQFRFKDDPGAEKRALLLAKIDPKYGSKINKGPFEHLRGHESKIDSPFIRSLITAALSPEKELPKVVSEFSTAEESEQLLFAAGYFFKEGELEKSFQTIKRLHQLPLSRTLRARTDGYLTHLGAILKSRKTPGFDPSISIRAALRLRRLLFGEEREFLAQHLVALGMEKEALKTKKPKPALSGGRSRSSYKPPTAGRYGILSLMLRGKRDAAIREGTKTLMGEIRASSSYVTRTIGVLCSLGIADDVLAKLEPRESASPARKKDFAKLAKRMDRRDLALRYYQDLHASDPADLASKANILLLTPLEQWKDAELSPALLKELASMAPNNHEIILKICDHTAAYLEKKEPAGEDDESIHWAVRFLSNWFGHTNFGLIHIVALNGERPDDFDPDPVAGERHIKSFKRLLEAIRNHPNSPNSFYLLLQMQSRLGIRDEDLILIARDSLLKNLESTKEEEEEEEETPAPYRLGALFRGYFSPGNFLLRQSDSGFLFSKPVLEKITAREPGSAQLLKLLQAIGKDKPEQAKAEFDRWAAALPQEKEERYAMVAELAAIVADTSPGMGEWTNKLEQQILEIAKDTPDPDEPDLFSDWGRYLAKAKGTPRMMQYLEALLETHLGTRDKWPLYYEIGYRWLPEELQRNLAFASAVIGYQIGEDYDGTLTGPIALMLIREDLLVPLERADDLLSISGFESDSIWYAVQGQAPEILEGVQNMGLLENPSGEDFILKARLLMKAEFHPEDDDSTWQPELLSLLRGKKDLNPALADIMASHLIPQDEKGDFINRFITSHPGFIEELQEKNPVELQRFLKWHRASTDQPDSPVNRVLASLQSEQIEEARKDARTWLDEGIPLTEPDTMGYRIWSTIISLSDTEPELARQVLRQTFQELLDWPKARFTANLTGGNSTVPNEWADYFLEILLRDIRADNLPSHIILLDQLVRGEAMKHVACPSTNSSSARRRLSAALDSPGEDNISAGLIRNSKHWAAKLNPGQQQTLLVVLADYLSDYWDGGNQNCLEVTTRIDRELRPLSPVLADGFATIALTSGCQHLEGEEALTALEQLNKHRTSLFNNLDLPAATYLYLLSIYAYNDPVEGSLFNDHAFTRATLSLLAEYLDSPVDPTGRMIPHLIRNLSLADYTGRPDQAADLIELCQKHLLTSSTSNDTLNEIKSCLIFPALTLGRKDLARSWMEDSADELKGNATLIFVLSSSGLGDLVKDLIPASPENYFRGAALPFQKNWPGEISKLLPQFPENHRIYLKRALEDRRDASGENAPDVSQKLRLDRLAALAAEHLPEDLGEKIALLSLLADTPHRQKILRPVMENELKAFDLAALNVQAQESRERLLARSLTNLLRMNCRWEISEGKTETTLRQLDSMRRASSNQHSLCGYMGNQFAGNLFDTIVQRASKGPAEAKAMAKFTREIFQRSYHYREYSFQIARPALGSAVVTHALANEFQALDDFLDSLDPAYRKWARNLLKSSNKETIFDDLSFSDQSEPVRHQFLSTLLASSWAQTNLYPNPKDLRSLIRSPIANQEDLLKAARKIPDDSPMKVPYLEALEKNSF